MSSESATPAAPLWAHLEPPAGLSAQWERDYRALVDPITRTATLRGMADGARGGTRELFEAWLDGLRTSVAGARVVLRHLHGRSQRTWRVGQAILTAITPIEVALCAAARFLARPHLTPIGPEATARSLRADVAERLISFDPDPLLDQLSAAVVGDSTAQLGQPASVGPALTTRGECAKKPKRPAKQPTVPVKYRKAVELWPAFQAAQKGAARRATLRRFRSWLRLDHDVVLNEDFDRWWRNTYTRMLRRAVGSR